MCGENDKTLLKDVKEYLNKWDYISRSWTQRPKTVDLPNLFTQRNSDKTLIFFLMS